MILALLVLMLLGEARYHHVAIRDLPQFLWPRACVVGVVGRVRVEADNDIHFRLTDAGAFVVVEIIPQLPQARPKPGQRIRACGIVRVDRAHQWIELHPLTSWEPRS